MDAKVFKVMKFVGIGLGIIGGLLTTFSDGGELIDAAKELKKPELPGPIEEKR